MRKALVALLAVAAGLFALPATAGASGTTSTAKVWVTHGLPLDDKGTVVDVYVNDGLAIDDFTFGRTVGPLSLPAATYDVEIRTPDGATTLIQKDVAVPARGSFSLVASFVDAAGTPGINVFANDSSRTKPGFARVALHHAAAAPAVDVDAGLFPLTRWFPHLKGEVVSNAPNGAQANLVLPTFLRYTVDVRVADTNTVVLPVDNFKVTRGVLTNVYVVGSAANGTLQPLVVTIPNGS
jgi:hypothetical protein